MANPYGDQPLVESKPSANPYGDLPQSEWSPLVKSGDNKPSPLKTIMSTDVGKMARSAPQSAAGLVEAALMPVYRPVETLQGLGNTSEALFEKMMSSQMESMLKLAGNEEDIPTPKWDNLTSHYRKTYGSAEGFKNALETDPFGVFADGLSVVFGGTAATRMIKKAGAKALPKDLPNNWLEEAAKFPTGSKKLTNESVKELVQYMLDENIPLTTAGIERLDTIIKSTGKIIDDMIVFADNGQTIPRRQLNDVLAQLKNDSIGKTALSGDDRAIIQTVIDGWENEIQEFANKTGRDTFTLQELQQFKQDTYGKVNWNADDNAKQVLNSTLKKQALSAKEKLEAQVPGIKEANARQGTGLDLAPRLDASVRRIDRNKGNMSQFLGTGTGTAMGAGVDGALFAAGIPIPPGVFTGLGTAAGSVKGFYGQPQRKAALAQAIYDARRADPNLVDIPLAKAMSIYLARENQSQYKDEQR